MSLANNYFDGTEKCISNIVDKLKQKDENFRVRKMHRFSYSMDIEEYDKLKNNKVGTKTDNFKEMVNKSIKEDKVITHSSVPLTYKLIKNIEFNASISLEDYMERKKQVLDEKRQYVIIENNKIASLAFISDIYEGSGNIVVFTNEDNRNKGYGKDVVKGCLEWCIKEDVLQIYLVEDNNKASLSMPISLNFKKQSVEFIISK